LQICPEVTVLDLFTVLDKNLYVAV